MHTSKFNDKEDYTFIDDGAPNWTFGLLDFWTFGQGCMIYILLFEEYYMRKSAKRIRFHVEILSIEGFWVEDHGLDLRAKEKDAGRVFRYILNIMFI